MSLSLPLPADADGSGIVAYANSLLVAAGPLPPNIERLALQIGAETFVLLAGALARQPEGEERRLDATVVFRSAVDCCAVARGELSPQDAFATGRLQVKGRLSALLAMRPHLASLGENLTRSGLFESGGSSFAGSSCVGSTSGWLPNDASTSCMACGLQFNLVRRRHHCRACGKLFCARCSPKTHGEQRQCLFCLQAKALAQAPSGAVAPLKSTSSDFEGQVTRQLQVLDCRLEDMETSSARKEANDFLAAASAQILAVYVVLIASVAYWVSDPRVAASMVLLTLIGRWFLVRHVRAVWFAILILWKLYWTKFEAERLCDADSKKFLSARHRVMAALATRGLRELGGVWPKVGQYLSSQGDRWPDEVLLEFSKLRDSMPAAPLRVTRKTIEEDLRLPMSQIFHNFAEIPIASASIGQVHRATLLDGTDVAVKVQHRHAASQIPADVFCMRMIARLVWLLTWGELDAMPVVAEWLGAVLEELDFEQEARSQMRGRRELAAAGVDVVVPEIYPTLCGRRVLVMEFIVGQQVTADEDLTPDQRLAVMTDLVRAYAHGLFVSGHFNGDPHAGNLLVERSRGRPRCVLLDWGLTKTLREDRRLASCQLVVATGMKDTCGIIEAFRNMGLNFSLTADPEPELLLVMLRHISLIEKQTESRKITQKVSHVVEHAVKNNMDLHTKVDSYTGDFFFFFRVATLIKGLSAILDIRADFLDIFIETSRNALRGPPPRALTQQGVPHASTGTSRQTAKLKALIEDAISRNEAVGVQVAVVAADGSVCFSAAYGMVSYTSWQLLRLNDGFPLGAPWLARPMIATATAAALKRQGVELEAEALKMWPKFRGPLGTSVRRMVEGGAPRGALDEWAQPPAKAFTRLLGDGEGLAAWLETAPATEASAPPWWPPAAHAVACELLLRAAGAASLCHSIRGLFVDTCVAGVACGPASSSPVLISKPIMSVESAEVMASQDALLASVGNEELRCIHLMDPCIANHKALRSSESMPCGLAASARSVAAVAARAHREGLVDRGLWASAGELGCVRRSETSGDVAVAFLTCANADLARSLADLALQ